MPEERITPAPVVEPNRIMLFDRRGNTLIASWTSKGVLVGDVLIEDEADADLLAAFITREDDSV